MAQKLTLLQSGEILLNLVTLNLLGQQNNKKFCFLFDRDEERV